MNKQEFNRPVADFRSLLYGDFKPDERQIALYERLEQYYRDTPNDMCNRTARKYLRELKLWCDVRGYTREEISQAKRNIRA